MLVSFGAFGGDVALVIALFCLVLNIRISFFMRKARKNLYYTDPLFAESDLTLTEKQEEMA